MEIFCCSQFAFTKPNTGGMWGCHISASHFPFEGDWGLGCVKHLKCYLKWTS